MITSTVSPTSGRQPMIAICPVGHSSLAQDYCDVCGLPIDSTAAAPPATGPAIGPTTGATSSAPRQQPCPNCGAANSVDALFCENCGYDFTTGTMPRPLVASEPPDATRTDQVQSDPDRHRPEHWRRPQRGRRDIRLGSRGLDRSGLVRSPAKPGSDALPRAAGRRSAAFEIDLDRPYLSESEHPSADRL